MTREFYCLVLATLILLPAIILADSTYVSGDVSGVWDSTGSPYLVTGDLRIPSGSILEIGAGVSVIFQGHYKLKVEGILKARGTSEHFIRFRPADTTDWSPGWHGIRFYNASDACTLLYCDIGWGQAYGPTRTDSCGGGIYCSSSDPIISHCVIRDNLANRASSGIYTTNSSPTIIANTIRNNRGDGVYCTGGNVILSDNLIKNNAGSGIKGAPMEILYNTIIENESNGIYLTEKPTIIKGNTISKNESNGVFCAYFSSLSDSILLEICANTISNNSLHGLSFGLSTDPKNTLVHDNIISNNRQRGIYCRFGENSFEIYKNIIFGNRGGGIHYNGEGHIYDNIIIWNSTELGYYSVAGGGIHAGGGLYIYDNLITNNFANGAGGGIYCDCDEKVTYLKKNKIIKNESANSGGGIFVFPTYGIGILEENIILENKAASGGGICCASEYSHDEKHTKILNNTIANNLATVEGGGLYCAAPSPFFYNNTLYNNQSAAGRELYFTGAKRQGIFNCIVFNDSSGGDGDVYVNGNCTLSVAYCDIDTADAVADGGSAVVSFGPSNFYSDPLFADTFYHLSSGSPCIDAGSGAVYMPTYDEIIYPDSSDFDGQKRPLDGGWDIGADEYDSGYTPPVHDQLAILVNTGSLWHTDALKNAYLTSVSRGFNYDEIFVLHTASTWDIDSTGVDDVNGICNRLNLGYAFENWAPPLAGPGTKLYVFFTGPGGTNTFSLRPTDSTISASELGGLFDSYSTRTGADSIFFIYDAPHSGSFIDEVSAPGRVITTSTSAALGSWMFGAYIFPDLLFNKLAAGSTFADAFNFTAEAIEAMVGDSFQLPLLDDNGDGTGHTDPLPNGGDGTLASRITWGESSKECNRTPTIVAFSVDTSGASDSIYFQVKTEVEAESCWVFAVREDTTYSPPDTCGLDVACYGVIDPVKANLRDALGFSYKGALAKSDLRGEYRFLALAQGFPVARLPFGLLSMAEAPGVIYENIERKQQETEKKKIEISTTPNPFSEHVDISYTLTSPAEVAIKAFDIMGNYAGTLVERSAPAGTYSHRWSPTENLGNGIYIIKLRAGDKAFARKVLYLR